MVPPLVHQQELIGQRGSCFRIIPSERSAKLAWGDSPLLSPLGIAKTTMSLPLNRHDTCDC